ncbi:hypothetical protein A33M_3497 [Rhodovulum sp. PH10]|nr:hypothetical protein A33M_3497 [Rhodovulum sp. PH10]
MSRPFSFDAGIAWGISGKHFSCPPVIVRRSHRSERRPTRARVAAGSPNP